MICLVVIQEDHNIEARISDNSQYVDDNVELPNEESFAERTGPRFLCVSEPPYAYHSR